MIYLAYFTPVIQMVIVFERLKENYSGFCSKRIDKKNRLIYKVDDYKIIVLIVSVLGHYE